MNSIGIFKIVFYDMLVDIQIEQYLMVKQNWHAFTEVSQKATDSISLSHITPFEKKMKEQYVGTKM